MIKVNLTLSHLILFTHWQKWTRNASGDEIANVNFFTTTL